MRTSSTRACEEYALDALIDYGVVPDDPFREVPNPRWIALDKLLHEARQELFDVHAVYGQEALIYKRA